MCDELLIITDVEFHNVSNPQFIYSAVSSQLGSFLFGDLMKSDHLHNVLLCHVHDQVPAWPPHQRKFWYCGLLL